MKSAEQLRAMTSEQLNLTLKDTIKHLFLLRVQSATERLETPSEIRKARKEIARIKTIQTQRRLEREFAASLTMTAQKGRTRSNRQTRRIQRGTVKPQAPNPRPSFMATLVETARKKLLEDIDPKGVHRETVRNWVATHVKPRSEFSLQDAIIALGKEVPSGGVSLSLADLVSKGVLQEFYHVEIQGNRKGEAFASVTEIPVQQVGSRQDQMVVPWYRKA